MYHELQAVTAHEKLYVKEREELSFPGKVFHPACGGTSKSPFECGTV